jgi:hypothetical protein
LSDWPRLLRSQEVERYLTLGISHERPTAKPGDGGCSEKSMLRRNILGLAKDKQQSVSGKVDDPDVQMSRRLHRPLHLVSAEDF